MERRNHPTFVRELFGHYLNDFQDRTKPEVASTMKTNELLDAERYAYNKGLISSDQAIHTMNVLGEAPGPIISEADRKLSEYRLWKHQGELGISMAPPKNNPYMREDAKYMSE